MSLLARIGRALQSPRRIPVDGAKSYGAGGEEMTRCVLDGTGYYVRYNPVVPHPERPGGFLETDAIVYGEGSLFCVEAKRYRGRLAWSYRQDGKRDLLKYKTGNYGEGIFEESHPDPLARTKFFISQLKRTLAEEDERFGRLYFHPVVAFAGDEGKISEVHCFEDGYVTLGELPAFIHSWRNERFADRRSRWIVDGLEGLPGWDRVIDRQGVEHYGVLGGQGVTLLDGPGCKRFVGYEELKELRMRHGGAFSGFDGVEAFTPAGDCLGLQSAFSSVELDSFDRCYRHRLRDVNRVMVGTQSLRGNGSLA